MAKAKGSGGRWAFGWKQKYRQTDNLRVLAYQGQARQRVDDAHIGLLQQLVAEQQRTNPLLTWLGQRASVRAAMTAAQYMKPAEVLVEDEWVPGRLSSWQQQQRPDGSWHGNVRYTRRVPLESPNGPVRAAGGEARMTGEKLWPAAELRARRVTADS